LETTSSSEVDRIKRENEAALELQHQQAVKAMKMMYTTLSSPEEWLALLVPEDQRAYRKHKGILVDRYRTYSLEAMTPKYNTFMDKEIQDHQF
jgi:hypothetical protein